MPNAQRAKPDQSDSSGCPEVSDSTREIQDFRVQNQVEGIDQRKGAGKFQSNRQPPVIARERLVNLQASNRAQKNHDVTGREEDHDPPHV